MQRLIIKLGTQVVIDKSDEKPAIQRLQTIVSEIVELVNSGVQVVVVSSGAVGLGKNSLSLINPLQLHEKQACAALGQTLLMNMYGELFGSYSMRVAQILVTASDFSDRERYLNLRNCLEECFRLSIVPIINENDVVSTAGIVEEGNARSFDDNDRLSSIVAAKIQADRLIILTNVQGVFSDNPSLNPEATLIKIFDIDNHKVSTEGTSDGGRGGMTSKLQAANIASLCGVETIISSGFIASPIKSVLNGDAGTIILPRGKLSSRNAWIGFASGHTGIIVVNPCTAEAIRADRKMSLLPIGVIEVIGDFSVKDIVSIQDESGSELARGQVSMSSLTINNVRGMHTDNAKEHLRKDEKPEVIHRDNMVILI